MSSRKQEPSVLDYVKHRLMPWKYPAPVVSRELGAPDESDTPGGTPHAEPDQISESLNAAPDTRISTQESKDVTPAQVAVRWPWRSVSAFGLALVAQILLEPRPDPDRWQAGLLLYIAALIFLTWAAWRKEWIAPEPPAAEDRAMSLRLSLRFVSGLIFLLLAYITFSNNRFNVINLFFWITGLVLTTWSALEPASRSLRISWEKLAHWLRQSEWRFSIQPWVLFWLAVFGISAYFRFAYLAEIPPEMNSDHAEKLLDVTDVLNGQYSIFFPRNTGREPIQFYLIAWTSQIFGTGVTFLSMKIGTAIAGLLTLPFIYLLGKEVANRPVGLLAMAFAGVAYWPNVLARVALRFSLYPLFVAPALYFLVRGLRTGNRNQFILSGLALGFGLLGYTPIRILPIVMVTGVLIFMLHQSGPARRSATQTALIGLALLTVFSFFSALPLLRFAQENPSLFAYRAFSRLTEIENPLSQPAAVIFLDNLKNAMLMFGWNNGQIWPVSIPGRPALDVVSASLFYLGLVYLLLRYLRQRNWQDLFLLLSVPMLMLPSILSLAFPAENPAPNRAGAAMVPVFIVVAISLHALYTSLHQAAGKRLATLVVLALLGFSAAQNHDLVFRQYRDQYTLSAWNTTEMGQVIHDFAVTSGSLDSAWVVKSAHWVDTRLVGIHAGNPTRDYGIDLANIPTTLGDPSPKLFLVRHFPQAADRTEEAQVMALLQQLYPQGWAQLYPSQYPGKEFWMFFTPSAIPGIPMNNSNPTP